MIAVTGTSGYLGRALLPALQNHFGRYPNVLSLGRQSPTNTQSRYLDLRAGADFRASLEGVKTLVHCAGLAHTRATAEEYEHVNVRATMSLADAAIAQGVGHFIYVSSMNVVPPDALNIDICLICECPLNNFTARAQRMCLLLHFPVLLVAQSTAVLLPLSDSESESA